MSSIDILLSVYGENPYFADFLQSLHAQSCQDFRLLYRFDGESLPENIKLLSAFDGAVESGDRTHCGFVRSYGTLLKKSSAEYVMFADQDDVWHSDKIEKTLTAMKLAEKEYGRETPLLVHSDLRVVDQNGNEIAPSMMHYQSMVWRRNCLKDLMIQNNVTGCTVMINRALAEMSQIPGGAISHDWFLAMTAAAFGKIVFIETPLIDYRQHVGNVYGAVPRRKLLEVFFLRRKLHKRLMLTQKQAKLFEEQFHTQLTPEQRNLLEKWSGNSDEVHYLKRLNTVIRYRFRKNDLLRTLGMWWAL